MREIGWHKKGTTAQKLKYRKAKIIEWRKEGVLVAYSRFDLTLRTIFKMMELAVLMVISLALKLGFLVSTIRLIMVV
jgi:hypothetical protein